LLVKCDIPLFSVLGIGIGIPGPVKEQSIVGFFANFDWEKNMNLKEKMEKLTGIETRIENDANIIAQGEAIFGAAKGKKSSITIAIGTGIGGGIFYNGNLISGMSGVGGEIGHMKVVKDGKTCGCGQNGCFEAYASASSLVKEAKERLKLNEDNLLFKEINGNLDELEAKNIFDAARKGDEFSKDGELNLFNQVAEASLQLGPSPQESFEQDYDLEVNWSQQVFDQVKHVFSHRKWHIQILAGQVLETKQFSDREIRWVSPQEFSDYPLAKPQQKIWQAYKTSFEDEGLQ